MREDIIYYLWLQCAFGVNSKSFKRGMQFFGTAEEFYRASEYDYKSCKLFKSSVIEKLVNKDMAKARKILADCERLGYDIVTFDDELFSDKLRAISAPPVLLYVSGRLPRLDEKLSIAMVGSRNATNQGLQIAGNFAYSFSKAGAVVVSGGAFGIDTASHKAVLDAGGVTVSVLGCGIDVGYPRDNISMYRQIAENGAVVSEYPPGYPASGKNFPTRNRIICGLSDCTLVVQAGEGSGALITAKDAMSEGRKLFSVPGSVLFAENKGSNDLLRQGYSAALEPDDILRWYSADKNSLVYSDKAVVKATAGISHRKKAEQLSISALIADKAEGRTRRKSENMSEFVEKAYKFIGDKPVEIDEISEKSGIAASELFSVITELEIMGYIEALAGGKYMRKQ